MNEGDCELWIALSDRTAHGEELSQVEVAFLQSHAGDCELCGGEANVWAALELALERPELLTDGLTQNVVLQAEDERLSTFRITSDRPRRWLRRSWVGAAGGAGILAAAAGWFFILSKAPVDESPRVAQQSVPAEVVLTSGEVELPNAGETIAGASMMPGDRLNVGAGAACLQWQASKVCVLESSVLSVESSTDQEHVLFLHSGQLVAQVRRQHPNTRFVVRTSKGEVAVKGTLFAVAVDDQGRVEVRVTEGAVSVKPVGSAEQMVRASRSLSLDAAGHEQAADASLLLRDAERMKSAAAIGNGVECRLDVDSSPSRADVWLDGSVLGVAPLSVKVPCGAHELALRLDGYEEVNEQVTVSEEPIRNRIIMRPLQPRKVDSSQSEPVEPTRSGAKPHSTPSDPIRTLDEGLVSSGELLARARRYRAENKYRQAAETYQQLVRQYPGSAEAGPALVSLGELQLSQLSEPAAALRSFESYLKAGGALAPEAHYGRIRALRQLGRTEEEEKATAQFVRLYPNSVQAARLRAKQSSTPPSGAQQERRSP